MAAAREAKASGSNSGIGFLRGELGDPPGGWPEPFRTRALEGRSWTPPAEELAAEDAAAKTKAATPEFAFSEAERTKVTTGEAKLTKPVFG